MSDTATYLRIIDTALARNPAYRDFLEFEAVHRTRQAVTVATRKYRARKRRR